jgi:ribosomal protein L37E
MALKKTLYCRSCKRETLHEEISYTEAAEYAREKNIFMKGFTVFLDHYPFAKVTFRTLAGVETIMQCNSCGFIRSADDSAD